MFRNEGEYSTGNFRVFKVMYCTNLRLYVSLIDLNLERTVKNSSTMEQPELNILNSEIDVIEVEEVEIESGTFTDEVCETKPNVQDNHRMVVIDEHNCHIDNPDREYVTFEEDLASRIKTKDIVEEAMEDLFADSDNDLEEDALVSEEILADRVGVTRPIRNGRMKVKLPNVDLEHCVKKMRPGPGRRKEDDSEKSTVERQIKESEEFRAKLERRPAKGVKIKNSQTFEEVQKMMAKRKEGYRCVTCEEVLLTRRALNIHMKTHSIDGTSFQCPECSRTFNQPCNLRRHMRSHSGERPFECLVCGKRFSDQGYLTTHARYHTDERPYVCAVCSKEFADRSNFVKHAKAHSGEKRHGCQLCPMAFVQLSDLTRHARVHSGARPFACDQCDRRYQQIGDLAQHKRQHSGERPFVCSKCGRTFANKRYLQGHERLGACCKAKAEVQDQAA